MCPDSQARSLATPNAGRKILRPDVPKVHHASELEDGSQGRRIDKGHTVALHTAEVPALVEQWAPQPPLMSIPVRIEPCHA